MHLRGRFPQRYPYCQGGRGIRRGSGLGLLHPVEDFSAPDVQPHLIVNDPRELAWLIKNE